MATRAGTLAQSILSLGEDVEGKGLSTPGETKEKDFF